MKCTRARDHGLLEEERKRGVAVTSAATTCAWRDDRMSLIDTPGHVN